MDRSSHRTDHAVSPEQFAAGFTAPSVTFATEVPIREARRVLKPGGLFAACAPNRDSDPELAGVQPRWGEASTFDGEDAAAIVGEVFSEPGDRVDPDPWDGPYVTLASVADAAARLRVHGLSAAAARDAAATLEFPLTLTVRGCFVYATKAAA